MATLFFGRRCTDHRVWRAVLPSLLGGLLASCAYTQHMYELHSSAAGAPLSTKDIARACFLVSQIAAQEGLQPIASNDTAVIRRFRKKAPVILTSSEETYLGLCRTADENVVSFGVWLNRPDSSFFSRRLEQRVFERFKSEFGANRIITKTYRYPIPIGF